MPSLTVRLARSEADRLTVRAIAQEINAPGASCCIGPGSSSRLNTANWRTLYNGPGRKPARPLAVTRGRRTRLTNNPSEWRRLFNG